MATKLEDSIKAKIEHMEQLVEKLTQDIRTMVRKGVEVNAAPLQVKGNALIMASKIIDKLIQQLEGLKAKIEPNAPTKVAKKAVKKVRKSK
jgi:hypothetical protein